MREYLELVKEVINSGSLQTNRTGVKTYSLNGAMLKYDLDKGFPAITTRRVAFKSAIAEMCGFFRPVNNSAKFRAMGCKVWDQNANENLQWLSNPFRKGEDDLGKIYGMQWRRWSAYKKIYPRNTAAIEYCNSEQYSKVFVSKDKENPYILFHKEIDQVRQCLDTIITDPDSRRILFHGWNCADLDEMSLPPCHLLYHFHPNKNTKEISLTLYIRSNDLGLGAPFNLIEGAAILSLFGRLTGYKPRWFNYFIGDAHIYENHLEMLKDQLSREPFPMPRLHIADRIPDLSITGKYEPIWLDLINPDDFRLDNYESHPPIMFPMAV